MEKTDVEKYELIRYAHSRIHDPELIESASVLAVSDKNTVEDLLTVEENSAQMILPNLLYLGLKKIINNTTGDLSIHKADKTIRAKPDFLNPVVTRHYPHTLKIFICFPPNRKIFHRTQ